MFRFSIREVLWLTLVVALALGWWVDSGRIEKAVGKLERDQHALQEEFQDKMFILNELQRNSGESPRLVRSETIIYKITYPNGKIYIGKDRTGNLNYFGSPNHVQLAKELTWAQKRSFTVKREILWEGSGTQAELTQKETEFIVEFRSNEPAIGYNQWP